MISLILYLTIGAGLLVLLAFSLLLRRGSPEGGSEALLDARRALGTLQGELLPAEVVQRVFAKQDLEYVLCTKEEPVRELFIEERRRVALIWVGQVRRGVVSLRTFHRNQARHYARLSVKTEVQLALTFTALLLACRTLQVAFYLGGPYAAPRIVGTTVGAAARVCTVSERSLAFLNAGLPGRSVENAVSETRI